jgi:hypothetical protein
VKHSNPIKQKHDDRVRDRDPVKIIYIAGYGRSGSTLLGQMLGQLPGAVFVGELREIWGRGLIANEPCGCRRELRDCEFWNAVMEHAFGGLARVEPSQLVADQLLIDRNRHVPSLALLNRVPADFTAARRPYEYVRTMVRLYHGIAAAAGARLIVDSSKDPSSAYTIARAHELDLGVIHLLRDSRAVAHSWSRHKKHYDAAGHMEFMQKVSPIRSALEWDWFNGWSATFKFLRGRRVRYVSLRYEDFVRDPRASLIRVIRSLGLELDTTSLDFVAADGSVELLPNHAVSGNPARFSTGKIVLQPDEEWRTAMNPAQARWIKALTWPLMTVYGY